MTDNTTSARVKAGTLGETTQRAPAAPVAKTTNAIRPGKRKFMFALLATTVAVAGAAYGAYYYTCRRYHESTDDAYVSGNLVQLTPQVTGTVVAVDSDDPQIVKALRFKPATHAGNAVIESCRGQPTERVFTRAGQPVTRLHNSGWNAARRRAAGR